MTVLSLKKSVYLFLTEGLVVPQRLGHNTPGLRNQHNCSNASDDNKLFSLRNRARNGAGNLVVGQGAAVTKRSL